MKLGSLGALLALIQVGLAGASASPELQEFETVSLADLPIHSLAVKDPKSLGIDNVKQYSGYLNVGNGRNLFFWFFESRNDPKNDPVVLWLNGGPGCSSLEGMLFENGPSMLDSNAKPVRNKHSWNSKANVIFLDQPVDTGFSYAPEMEVTTAAASKDVVAFLNLFFHRFPQYAKNDFHISGESYAGHYIPVLASDILSASNLNFNLSSILIGNGLTDPLTQYRYYAPMACGQGGYRAVLNRATCNVMSNSINACENAIRRCYDNPSNRNGCFFASVMCDQSQMTPYQNSGLNPYDVRRQCEGDSSMCYTGMSLIPQYLNRDDVKQALGVSPDRQFSDCNDQINIAFNRNGDWMLPIHLNIAKILDHIPVLIYAGDKDYICNWLGNRAWTKALEWSGQQEFNNAPTKPWTGSNRKRYGEATNYKGFTFLRVFDAGHMVPHDQPEAALDMLNRWLDGDHSFQKKST